jgi:hypothetical protein
MRGQVRHWRLDCKCRNVISGWALKTRLIGTCPDVTVEYTTLHCSEPGSDMMGGYYIALFCQLRPTHTGQSLHCIGGTAVALETSWFLVFMRKTHGGFRTMQCSILFRHIWASTHQSSLQCLTSYGITMFTIESSMPGLPSPQCEVGGIEV